MAKREVDLIIKARNDTAAAGKAIVDLISSIGKAQTDLAKNGKTANTALGGLTTELSNLQKTAAGLTGLVTLTRTIGRATAELGIMEKSLGETEAKLKETQGAAAASASRFEQLGAAAKEAGLSLAREETSLAGARAEQARLNAEVAEAQAQYKALAKAVDPTSAAFDKQVNRADAARDALDRLILRQQKQAAAVTEQQHATDVAGLAFQSLTSRADLAGRAIGTLNNDLQKTAASFIEQAGAVDTAGKALVDMKASASGTAAALGGIEAKEEAIANESARVVTAVNAVTAALEAQRRATANAAAIQTQDTTPFQRQQEAVDKARQAFKTAKEELAKLRAEFAATAEPSQALTTQLRAAEVAVSATGQQFRTQITVLDRLRDALRKVADGERAKAAADRDAAAASAILDHQLGEQIAAEERVALVARILGRDISTLSAAMRGVSGAANQAGQGLDKFGSGGRQALSLVQRMRGEVLSVTTQFVGLYAAISQVGGVIDAIRAVEAAQSRLNAVFDSDGSRVREELRFLSQEADRLGLSFRVLSNEYGRFAIATNAANFSADATRKIFIAVAEAARVNKVTTEELEGTYLALQQMVSKGTVSMEELRRQLGDRLPGAFNIFADALGVSTAKLTKMLAAGQVVASQETLLKFAAELEKRFGGALPKALETVTTQIDRFSNNLFEAQARIASGGFADALEDSLRRLNEFFRSREGRDFFLEIGAAAGNLVRVLTFVGENIKPIVFILQSVVAINAALFFRNLALSMQQAATIAGFTVKEFLAADTAGKKMVVTAASGENAFKAFGFTLGAFITQLRTAVVTIASTGPASAASRVALQGLGSAFVAVGTAIKGMVLSLGIVGAISLVIGGLISVFTDLATTVPDATRAIDEHNRILDSFQKEANEADRAGRDFNATLVDTSKLAAQANLEELKSGFAGVKKEANEAADKISQAFLAKLSNGDRNAIRRDLKNLRDDLTAGKITVFEFQTAVAKMADEMDGAAKGPFIRYASQLIRTFDKSRELEVAITEQSFITKTLGGVVDKAAQAWGRYGFKVDEARTKLVLLANQQKEQEAQEATRQTAEDKVKTFIPEEARKLDQDSRSKALQDASEAALKGLEKGSAAFERVTAENARALAALKKAFAEEDKKAAKQPREARDAQKEFNDELRRTNEEREFEASLVGDSARDQAIYRAQLDAIQKAEKAGAVITDAQIAAIRETVGAQFDANEALRIKNLIIDEQLALEKELGVEQSTQALVEQEAREKNINLLTLEGKAWAEVKTQIIDREKAEAKARQMTEDVRAVSQEYFDKVREFQQMEQDGAFKSAEQKQQLLDQLEALRVKLVTMRDTALAFARAINDEKLIAALEKINADISVAGRKTKDLQQELKDTFAQGATDAILDAGEAIGKAIEGTDSWGEALENVGDIFRSFAADFLREIARMIVQRAILDAIGGSVAHTGGVIGRTALPQRKVSPLAFAGAARYHSGGIAGIRNGEVPAILQRGEEVVTRDDPRHVLNGGGGGGTPNLKVVNMFDAGSVVSEALNTEAGEKAFLNVVRRRGPAIQQLLSGGA